MIDDAQRRRIHALAAVQAAGRRLGTTLVVKLVIDDQTPDPHDVN